MNQQQNQIDTSQLDQFDNVTTPVDPFAAPVAESFIAPVVDPYAVPSPHTVDLDTDLTQLDPYTPAQVDPYATPAQVDPYTSPIDAFSSVENVGPNEVVNESSLLQQNIINTGMTGTQIQRGGGLIQRGRGTVQRGRGGPNMNPNNPNPNNPTPTSPNPNNQNNPNGISTRPTSLSPFNFLLSFCFSSLLLFSSSSVLSLFPLFTTTPTNPNPNNPNNPNGISTRLSS